MKLSVRRVGSPQPSDNAPRSRVVKPKILAILILAAIAVGAYFVIHNHNQSSNSPTLASAKTVDKVSRSAATNYLKKNDLDKYQLTQVSTATVYWENKDYKNAERVMLDLFKNVPEDNVTADSYMMMVSIEKSKGDSSMEKKYLQLLIPKLQSENDTQAISYYKSQLSALH